MDTLPVHLSNQAQSCSQAAAHAGWVCYAEKTHGKDILPHLCAAKSPQAVAGTLVKSLFCPEHKLSPHQTYHVAIMPCFDKKLEAAREELTVSVPVEDVARVATNADASSSVVIPETDCVLTTSEIHDLLLDRGEVLAEQPAAELDPWVSEQVGLLGGWRGVRGGSGGYLEYSMKAAAREIYNVVRGCIPATLPFSLTGVSCVFVCCLSKSQCRRVLAALAGCLLHTVVRVRFLPVFILTQMLACTCCL
jgi:hypothetical protein